MLTLRSALCAAGLVIGLGAASAGASTTSLASLKANSAGAAAGPPAPTSILLCGNLMTGGDRFSGASNIDHPSGSSATGTEYPFTGQNCESENGKGGTGMFTWTISHSNVDVVKEMGTEHGIATLSTDANKAAGFNGRITNYDFNDAPDNCNGMRNIYYASGHQFDPATCSPSAPGNFNTHGGAATGDHFNGKYGTVVYQDTSDTSTTCQAGSSTYCFEAIIIGQTN